MDDEIDLNYGVYRSVQQTSKSGQGVLLKNRQAKRRSISRDTGIISNNYDSGAKTNQSGEGSEKTRLMQSLENSVNSNALKFLGQQIWEPPNRDDFIKNQRDPLVDWRNGKDDEIVEYMESSRSSIDLSEDERRDRVINLPKSSGAVSTTNTSKTRSTLISMNTTTKMTKADHRKSVLMMLAQP